MLPGLLVLLVVLAVVAYPFLLVLTPRYQMDFVTARYFAAPLRTAAPRSHKALQARPDRDTPPLTIETALLLPRSVSISDPHWCYPPDGTFCDQVFAPYPR